MAQPLFAGGPSSTKDVFLEELPSSLGATLRATAGQAWDTNPLSLILQEDAFRGNRRDTSPRLSAEEARTRVTGAGLKLNIPDDGIRESALNLLMESKYQEKVWQDTISRGPTGFAAGAARFGVGLGASILDPINIASAFIPFVGEARLASMLARAGAGFGSRALVRAQVGAVEGLAGAAVVEPFVLAMAHDLQKDYTAADSLLNLAFGTILGGGLHVGVGAVRDHVSRGGDILTTPPVGPTAQRIAALPPEDRMTAFRTALAQAIDGRTVDVEPIISMRESIRDVARAEATPGFLRTAEDRIALRHTDRTAEFERGVTVENTPGFLRTAEDVIFKRSVDSGDLEVAVRRDKIAEELKGKSEDEISDLLVRKMEDQRVREQLLADDKLMAMAAEERSLSVDVLREKVERQKAYFDEDIDLHVQAAPRVDLAAAKERMDLATQKVDGAVRDAAAPVARVHPDDMRAAEESFAAVRVSESETRAQDTDSAKVVEAEKALLTEEARELKSLEDALEAAEPSKFTAEDQLIADTETLAKAADALARCQLRN